MKKQIRGFFWEDYDNPIHDPHYTHNAILNKNSMKTNTLDLGEKNCIM
jgi:hypothetical protein